MMILRILGLILLFIFVWAIATVISLFAEIIIEYIYPKDKQVSDAVYKRKVHSIYGFILAAVYFIFIFK